MTPETNPPGRPVPYVPPLIGNERPDSDRQTTRAIRDPRGSSGSMAVSEFTPLGSGGARMGTRSQTALLILVQTVRDTGGRAGNQE